MRPTRPGFCRRSRTAGESCRRGKASFRTRISLPSRATSARPGETKAVPSPRATSRRQNSGVLFPHLVTDAVNRHYVDWLLGMRLEFFAQVVDMAVERALVDSAVVVELVEKLCSREDAPGFCGERRQYAKLGRRQLDMRICATHVMRVEIDCQIVDAKHLPAPG